MDSSLQPHPDANESAIPRQTIRPAEAGRGGIVRRYGANPCAVNRRPRRLGALQRSLQSGRARPGARRFTPPLALRALGSTNPPMGTTAIARAERRSSAGLKSLDASVVGTLLATLPPLTNVQRQAFREQFTLAQCDAIGMLAEAPSVYREALAWLRPIDRTAWCEALGSHFAAVAR